MCYFVSVGARAPAQFMAQVFDGEAELDVGVSPACMRFPSEDLVRQITWRGCSCDLVSSSSRLSSGQPPSKVLALFRRSVVRMVREFGSARVLVHGHGVATEPDPRATPDAAVALTVREFLSRESWFVEGTLVAISEETYFSVQHRPVAKAAANTTPVLGLGYGRRG